MSSVFLWSISACAKIRSCLLRMVTSKHEAQQRSARRALWHRKASWCLCPLVLVVNGGGLFSPLFFFFLRTLTGACVAGVYVACTYFGIFSSLQLLSVERIIVAIVSPPQAGLHSPSVFVLSLRRCRSVTWLRKIGLLLVSLRHVSSNQVSSFLYVLLCFEPSLSLMLQVSMSAAFQFTLESTL